MIPYSTAFPWHIQIHRDPFYYNEIGPRADPRTVIDLRFFGKGDLKWENSIQFGSDEFTTNNGWKAGVTDIYGMPQVTVSECKPPMEEFSIFWCLMCSLMSLALTLIGSEINGVFRFVNKPVVSQTNF
jgi:hypothetical protein